jgi:hypothetical protein
MNRQSREWLPDAETGLAPNWCPGQPELGKSADARDHAQLRRLPCTCPGNVVPFYCRKHGRVENPNWPLLKQPTP